MGVGKWKKVQMGISLIFTKNATRYQTTFWIHEEIECVNVYIWIYRLKDVLDLYCMLDALLFHAFDWV